MVTADFLTELPASDSGYDMVLQVSQVVMVDKLSKRKNSSSQGVAQMFHDHLFSKHGGPISIQCAQFI